MYNLSKILKAIDLLNSIDPEQLLIFEHDNLNRLVDVLTDFDLINRGKAKRNHTLALQRIAEANAAIEEILELTEEFREKILLQKQQSHQTLLKEVNNKPYTFEWPDDKDYLRHRQEWAVSESVIDQTVSLIGKHIDWRFPVVYFEPHIGELIRYLVAGDPFYIVDDRLLPYKNILETVPPEAVNRIYHYRKSDVSDLEPNSAGMCVSWKNIPFKKLGEVRKDITAMSNLVAPGGYVVFDYVDAGCAASAEAIEKGEYAFQWRERILQFLTENNLEILHEIEFVDYCPVLLFCKKSGELPSLNLNNKLGLVIPDQDVLAEKRRAENENRKFYRSMTSSLEKDLAATESRDKLLNQLDQQRKIDTSKITENKLKSALNQLNVALTQYPSHHPIVLEALLKLSKLTHSMGRIKDSVNLIKRAGRDVDSLDPSSRLYKEYREWQNFLNNIDTRQ